MAKAGGGSEGGARMRLRPAAAATCPPLTMPTRKPAQAMTQATAAATGYMSGDRTRTSNGTQSTTPRARPARAVTVPASSSPGGIRSKGWATQPCLRWRNRPSAPPMT